MKRAELLGRLNSVEEWDMLIIGGGATGLGSAVEAAARGYNVLLVEQDDFAKGTSSRSTKLSHGGVRYLEQGDIKLVFSALRERGLMLRNAPHIFHTTAFIIPAYRWWEKIFYGFGLWFYEVLSGRRSLGHSRILSLKETIRRLPTIKTKGLRGGILYMDGQFDDARMAITLARTCIDLGGTPLNFMRMIELLKKENKVHGATIEDVETGKRYTVRASSVINATGIFTDDIRKKDQAETVSMLSVSQGTHLILDKSFLPSTDALMIPKTEDGRVLFALPWYDHLMVGTTDVPVPSPVLEPRALEEEISFLLRHASKYLSREVKRSDVLSVFSGQRPLVKKQEGQSTAQLSRDHTIIVSPSGMITITGGKWTSYRHMGEDVINHFEKVAKRSHRNSKTASLALHGAPKTADVRNCGLYGTDREAVEELAHSNLEYATLLHPKLTYRVVDVIWAVRNEMARTLEDVLARRTRALFINAQAALDIAPIVAKIMSSELHRDAQWEVEQLVRFKALAHGYLLF